MITQAKSPRSMRIPDWLREPGVQVIRADLLMVPKMASKADIDLALEELDEDNIPIIAVTWEPGYGKFLPIEVPLLGSGYSVSTLIQALTSMGREYLKVEVVGDPILKAKWLVEEEETEDAPPLTEEEQ